MKKLAVLVGTVLSLALLVFVGVAWKYNSGDLYDVGCLQDGMDILATSDTAGVFYPVSVLGGTNNTQAITIRGLVYFHSAAQFPRGTTNAVSIQGTNDVNTGVNFADSDVLGLTTAGRYFLYSDGSMLRIQAGANRGQVFLGDNYSNTQFTIVGNLNEAFHATNNNLLIRLGKVVIGSTQPTAEYLTVNGGTRIQAVGNTNEVGRIIISDSTLQFKVGNDGGLGTLGLSVSSNGYVGIAKTNAECALSVYGANESSRGQVSIGASDIPRITFYKGAEFRGAVGVDTVLGVETNLALNAQSGYGVTIGVNGDSATPAVRVSSGELVGINNINPTNTLDVLGSISASGKAIFGSTTNANLTGTANFANDVTVAGVPGYNGSLTLHFAATTSTIYWAEGIVTNVATIP